MGIWLFQTLPRPVSAGIISRAVGASTLSDHNLHAKGGYESPDVHWQRRPSGVYLSEAPGPPQEHQVLLGNRHI